MITGRITEADGRPMIEEEIAIESSDKKVKLAGRFEGASYQTDDRGIYRIYGLPAGQYVVSVGLDNDVMAFSSGRGQHSRTYSPGTTDRPQAKSLTLPKAEKYPESILFLDRGGSRSRAAMIDQSCEASLSHSS